MTTIKAPKVGTMYLIRVTGPGDDMSIADAPTLKDARKVARDLLTYSNSITIFKPIEYIRHKK